MMNLVNVNEFEYKDFKEGLSSVLTLDMKFLAFSEGFVNDSWSIYNGYSKQDNKESVIMDTICLVEEIEKESSYISDFSSYTKSFHEDENGNEFKVYTNALYDEEYDEKQPIFCPNF